MSTAMESQVAWAMDNFLISWSNIRCSTWNLPFSFNQVKL